MRKGQKDCRDCRGTRLTKMEREFYARGLGEWCCGLIGHADYLQILLTLRRRKNLRFSQIQSELKLNQAQVTRGLKYLRNGLWIIPRAVPTKGERIFVDMSLVNEGSALG